MNTDPLHLSNAEILVIDDTPANLDLLAHILSEQGYKVRVAPNGKLALQSAKAIPPHLILLDIMMPEMDGYAVCEALKADEKTRDIPVIFLSALDNATDKMKAFQVGGADYISKPFEVIEVLARIENQLRARSLQLQLQEKNQHLHEEVRQRRRTEVEIRLLLATTQAIARCEDIHAALTVVLRLLCQTIHWDYGEAWLPRRDREGKIVLEYSRGWYARNQDLSEVRERHLDGAIAPDVGLFERIYATQEPLWIETIETENSPVLPPAHPMRDREFQAAFAIPIVSDRKILAILVFLNCASVPLNSWFISLASAVAAQLGSTIARKQAEENLRITQERYHNLVKNAIEGIFQVTPSGQYLSANLALAKMFGYESPEDLTEGIQNIDRALYVNSSRRAEFIAAIEAEGSVVSFESQVYRRDHTTIWISENARAVRDEEGKILYYEGTVSNITERKLAQEALQFQKEQIEKLLLNILPKPIAQRLQTDSSAIADSFPDVSVLFADLVGFTKFSAHKTPRELVQILNSIFSQFDRLCEKYHLEKIKTIGDAYMVVGGLPNYREDHGDAIAQMALEMQTALTQFNIDSGQTLQLRIGIHIGPVIAGIIGISKFIYDLWGDTVNVASRMESSGIPGKIQATEVFYKRLNGQFVFRERGTIPIKGKGEMRTYLLLGRRSTDEAGKPPDPL
ncbi:response regulator [Lusitaniella coriacea LEGE 07157]|uniref:Adenylate cyclase n=1 Tax=Lusitaniella coriacea LEGE 07157 TaxID=945747 RepID=A0A8J7DZ22_9CYAN|nr:adenylate/guanylate cyclase domain-containing protein [Lusitaniella coriacea]MBE9117927.1 response regulator [Lusitaniella coriacea LEGE 07157]